MHRLLRPPSELNAAGSCTDADAAAALAAYAAMDSGAFVDEVDDRRPKPRARAQPTDGGPFIRVAR
jgi:hypothetical protein